MAREDGDAKAKKIPQSVDSSIRTRGYSHRGER